MDVSAREWHEAPVFDSCATGRGGIDDDFSDYGEVFEDELVLDVEERLESGLVDDSACSCDDCLGIAGKRRLDFGADLGCVVCEDVVGVEVADEAACSSEVLLGGVGCVDRCLVL